MWQPGEGRSAWVEGALRAATAALAGTVKLSPADAERFRLLAGKIERYPPGALVNALAPTPTAKWIISGWLCQMRILPDARRQIFGFLLPGDIAPSHPPSGGNFPSLLALTRLECVDVSQMLETAALERERSLVHAAVAATLKIIEERKYDHIVRLGQHTAAERVVSLLLELRDRLAPLDLVHKETFRAPLTQEHLADALGLSLVHVHRTLKTLRAKGLLELRLGRVTLLKPAKLREIAAEGVAAI